MNACLAFCLSELWKIICWQSFCYEDIYNVKLIIKLGLRQNDPVTVEVKALQLDFHDYTIHSWLLIIVMLVLLGQKIIVPNMSVFFQISQMLRVCLRD